MKKSKAIKKAARKAAPAPDPVAKLDVAEGVEGMKQAIGIMTDPAAALAQRKAALNALQGASFGHPNFKEIRGEYVAGLRQVVDDAPQELRQDALEILSQEQDPYAEKKLVDGLRDDKKALVKPEDALHYLSYNLHAGVQGVVRNVFEQSKDDRVRQQAVRLMSSDPQAVKLIERTLKDKKESAEVRQTSAAALHALNPQALQKWAEKTALDKNENQEILAACLTAINQFGDEKTISKNTAFRKRISQMSKNAPPRLKQIAKGLSTKYGI
jgi:HEAT repeat protein